MWDPGQYLRYAGERARPFFDLLSRVQATDPGFVADLGCGPGPVVEWYRGTGLRPVLARLDAAQADRFLAEYRECVTAAYPPASYGTVLPFRRVFVVARVP
jgi:trans-aconitate methyltransferase